jgi:UDP-N-acetylmuramate dehydrogenase
MNNLENKLTEQLGEGFVSNVVLKDHTSFHIGGVADYFYTAKTINDLVKAVQISMKLEIPYFILGGGNNILVSDLGFPGLVIKNESNNLSFLTGSSEVIVDSGVNLGKLLVEAASRDLGGLEFLFGIPGTIGGAVYNNVGTTKIAVGDFVRFVTLLLPNPKNIDYKIIKYRQDWLDLGYRTSKLKELNKTLLLEDLRPVILTIKLQLSSGKREVILDRMRKVLAEKKSQQPLESWSAGSFFKNPGQVKEQTAGFLLDKIGAKKIKVGKAFVSKKHANFIINKGGARAEEVKRLAEQLKIKVRDEFKVNLEEEVEYVGRW